MCVGEVLVGGGVDCGVGCCVFVGFGDYCCGYG